MLRFSILFLCVFLVAGCTTVKVKDSGKASDLNAELGLAYLIKGRYDQALFKLRKSIKLNPDNAKAYHYTAELYRRLGEPEKAENFFKQAIDKDDNDPSINNNYGAFLCASKNYDEAFKYLELALQDLVYIDRAKVFENMGICSEQKGNIKIARDNYIQAIRLNPRLGKSLLAVARLDFDDQNVKSAAKYYKYYSLAARQTAESLWLGILIAKQQRDTKTKESLSWSLEKKHPNSQEAKLLKRLKASGEI